MPGHVTVQRQVLGQAGPGSAREAGSRDAALDQPAAGENTHYTLELDTNIRENSQCPEKALL